MQPHSDCAVDAFAIVGCAIVEHESAEPGENGGRERGCLFGFETFRPEICRNYVKPILNGSMQKLFVPPGMAQSKTAGFEVQTEKRLRCRRTHLLPNRPVGALKRGLLNFAESHALALTDLCEKSRQHVFFRAEIIEQNARAGADSLRQRSEGEISDPMRHQVMDNGLAQFVRTLLVDGSTHEIKLS